MWLAGGGCGLDWVESMGVVVRRYNNYIFSYYLSLLRIILCSLILQQHPYFLLILKMFFVLVPVHFCNKILCMKKNFTQYKHTYERLRASNGSHNYERLHIMFYTRRSTHKRKLQILRWISAVSVYMTSRGGV